MGQKHTNCAALWMNAAHLIQVSGRIHENELWLDCDHKRKMLDKEIVELLTDLADWAGFDLVKREAVKTEEAA